MLVSPIPYLLYDSGLSPNPLRLYMGLPTLLQGRNCSLYCLMWWWSQVTL